MDWNKVLHSPSVMDKDWYKNIRAPPIIELEKSKVKYNIPVVRNPLIYECVKCSRPLFTHFLSKEMALGEFAAGVDEEFLVFMKSCRVVVCTDRVSFNGNVFHVVACLCEEELGYFIVKLRVPAYSVTSLYDTFWVRGEKVKVRDSSGEMKLTEFVNNQARSALSHLRKSADSRSILTPAFMSAAGEAAFEVVNHILAGGVDEVHKANTASTSCLIEFLPEEPERLGDKQFVGSIAAEPHEATCSSMLSLRHGSNSED